MSQKLSRHHHLSSSQLPYSSRPVTVVSLPATQADSLLSTVLSPSHQRLYASKAVTRIVFTHAPRPPPAIPSHSHQRLYACKSVELDCLHPCLPTSYIYSSRPCYNQSTSRDQPLLLQIEVSSTCNHVVSYHSSIRPSDGTGHGLFRPPVNSTPIRARCTITKIS